MRINRSLRYEKKILHSRVNVAFNEELHVYFQTTIIRDDERQNRNAAYIGTSFRESSIALLRSAGSMMSLIETSRLDRHGTYKTLSTCPEFCKRILRKLFRCHDIRLVLDLLAALQNKAVERNNGTFRSVFEKICKEIADA